MRINIYQYYSRISNIYEHIQRHKILFFKDIFLYSVYSYTNFYSIIYMYVMYFDVTYYETYTTYFFCAFIFLLEYS